MTSGAITMMVLSILLLWGGLIVAVVHLGMSDKKLVKPPGRDL